jgi:predicted outer membrane repeat protein
MKLNKMMLVSMLLLAILTLGAVSAQEDSSADVLAVDSASSHVLDDGISYDKTIYVNTTGDDSNTGSQNSPYATINKGISSVNASDNAVIYLSKGTFTGDNNTDLSISLAHEKYGGSLTIIGQGNDKTFIDGESVSSFLKSVSGDTALTLINISFINGKASTGSMINCGGNLTVDNCVFENNYATGSQGAIVSKGMDLKVTNSVFKNNKASNQGPDICFNNNKGNVYIDNSSFYNATNTGYSCGASVYISNSKNAKITGNTFKDIVGNYNDAALQISSGNGQIMNNVFINCTNSNTDTGNWAQYGVIYLSGNNLLKQNKFINSSSNKGLIYNNGLMNAVITFNDVFTDKTTFTLSATITDDMGNTISSSRTIEFDIEGIKVGESGSNKGVATLSVSQLFDNGKHEITGKYNGENNTFNPATLTVDIDRTPVEFWVSTSGNDTTGDGSKNNPFNTINHAITAALDKSINITIHIMDGTYLGTGNVNLKYSRISVLNLIGENYGKTIIDGQDNDYFFYFDKGLDVAITNLTFTNGKAGNINGIIYGSSLTMNDCIIKNSVSNTYLVYDINTQNSKLFFDNLTYINNKGNMWLGYATINNSYFANNSGQGIGGLIRGTYNLTVTNSKFINNINIKNYNAEGGVIYAQNIISMNNIYDSNYAGNNGGAVYVSGADKATFINDTFMNNGADGNGGAVYSSVSNTKMLPVVTFENVKFINNSAVNGGALAISGATFNNVTFKDNSAKDMGGAIYLISVPNGLKSNIPDLIINDSLFENSSASQGKDIYISTPDSNSGIANVTGLTVTFNNLTTQFLADTVSASVSHISGAVIGGSSIKFYLNGTYMGTSGVVNGVASLDYLGFKNGVYNLSGDYVVAGARDKIINGTVKVALNALKDNVTIYVSDKLGDDVNGDGSLDKPFKTIKKALNYGYSQSTTLFVHILEGIYSGEGNTNIGLSSTVSVTITGAGVNKTILCGNQINDFFTVSAGTNIITIENMSMINGSKADAASVYPYTNVKNVHSPVIALPNSNVYLNNIYFENNKGNLGGAVLNSGNMKINNCSFVRNGFSSYGGGLTNNGTLIVDNSYFFANYAYRGANIFVIKDMTLQNSLVEESYWISGSHYGNIVGIDSGITLINTTVQNLGRTAGEAGRTDIQANRPGHIYFAGLNRVESYGCIFKYGESVAAGDIFGSFYGASWEYNWQDFIKFDNCSFINVKNIDSVGFRANLNRTGHVSLNNCILDIKGKVLTTSTFDILNITNCYIPDSSVVSWSSLNTPNAGIIDLNNNWWGSNTQPVFTIVSTNKTLVNMTPENWLVLTLDVTNKPGLLQDAVLTFKVFNGTNLTDYVGSLPVRDFNMSAANATLSVVNGTINNSIVNGFEAKEGNYTISATVDGQTVIYNGTASLGKGIINVTDSSLDYGEVVMVNATLVDTNGNGIANINMTLKVNGKTYYMVTDENGAVSFVIDPLDSGIYTLEFIVPASKVLSSVSNSSTLTINKAKDFIKADIDAGVAGEDVVIVVNGPKDLKENITVTVDKTNYNVVLVNGSASLTLKDLTAGNYDVTVSYPGDNNYYNQVIKTNFTVDINKKVNLNISDIVMIYKDGTRMIAVLTDYLGNPIANATLYFTINGKTYVKTTDDKGTASMGLNLVSKVYDATISYNGSDKYDAVSKNITVTINPTIISEDLVKMYQNATRFYAKFTDSTGKALANSEVRFNIHGVFYTKTTNKDGVADLGIMLRPGTYILTAYNPVTGEEKGFNITVKSLIVQNDLTKYYLNASRFQATIYNKDGSLAVNKEVTFNINGVFYTKTTDENGVASLGIALRPGSYIITTIFDGLAMGNNVVVIPTLVTKDLNMKYLDGSDFTAQTLDGQGKPLSNQNVSFNVNGVFYHKVTDENGIASLKIRLMSGEYIITSYWNDFQTGNTIKISP